MAETIRDKKWHPADIANDLDKQGHLPGVLIDVTSVMDYSVNGETSTGNKFRITWMQDQGFVLSMQMEDTRLVNAFSAVLGYKPCAKYHNVRLNCPTYEWLKVGSPADLIEMIRHEGNTDIQALN